MASVIGGGVAYFFSAQPQHVSKNIHTRLYPAERAGSLFEFKLPVELQNYLSRYGYICIVHIIGNSDPLFFFFNIIGAITRQKLDRKVIVI